jgi:hypothetical protein
MYCLPDATTFARGKLTRELDHMIASVFGFWELVLPPNKPVRPPGPAGPSPSIAIARQPCSHPRGWRRLAAQYLPDATTFARGKLTRELDHSERAAS